MIKNLSEKRAIQIVVVLSIVLAGVVGLLNWGLASRPEVNIDLHIFPKFHALLNSIVAVFLLLGLWFIKNNNKRLHQTSMVTAFVLSALFLVSYVVYHTLADPTSYGGVGLSKAFYLFLLLTHIVLAAIIMPFILMTFYYAASERFEKHRKLARITWPLWFYVAITGVIIYFMISPYYI